MSDPRFRFYRPEDRVIGENNDCVLRAACAVTGKPYAEIHALFARHGRKDRKGTYQETSHAAFAELGMRQVAFTMKSKIVYREGGEVYSPRAGCYFYRDSTHVCRRVTDMTVAKFLKAHPVGKFVLFVSAHAFAVIDGVIFDIGSRPRVRRYVESYFTFA